MSDVENWQALADAVRRRRLYLNLAQDELSRRAGPSHQTIRNIEQVARPAYSPMTFARLERSLGWRTGLIHDVLRGTATEEEIMPTDTPSAATPDPSDRRRLAREDVADRLDKIGREIAADPRLDVEAAYRLRLQVEEIWARLR